MKSCIDAPTVIIALWVPQLSLSLALLVHSLMNRPLIQIQTPVLSPPILLTTVITALNTTTVREVQVTDSNTRARMVSSVLRALEI